MKRGRCCIAALIAVVLLFMFVLILGGASYFFLQQGTAQNRVRNTAPAVIVNTPSTGATFQSGIPILANVTAVGMNPIARLEMWVDGELEETQTPEIIPGGENLTFQTEFELLAEEGMHILSWKAVDLNGLVGISPTIPVEVFPIFIDEEITAEETPPEGAPESEADQPAPEGPVADNEEPAAPQGAQPSAPGGTGTAKKPPKNSGSKKPDKPPGTKLITVATTKIDFGALIIPILWSMPKAPTGLQAGFEDCSVGLVWFDNSDNETGYEVWIQRLGGPPQRIDELGAAEGTGPVSYEFQAPPFGIYSVWVEAVRGAFKQPSEIKGMAVNDEDCPQTALATMLEIEGKDMSFLNQHDQVYCYVSLDGYPHQRIPETEGEFIQITGNAGDIFPHMGGKNRILLPMPEDRIVSVDGECLKIVGDKTVSLGEFHESVPMEFWDGRRLQLQGDSEFTVGYTIKPHGPATAQGIYKYTDNSVPQPMDLSIKSQSSPDPVENARLGRTPELHWAWTGDPASIDGFNILLDGEFYRWAAPEYNWTTLLLPTSCGGEYNLQVAVIKGDGTSPPSPVLHYKQPLCEVYAEVTFDSFTFTYIDDGLEIGATSAASCDTAELFFHISADGKLRYFGNDEFTFSRSCGTYIFKNIPQFEGEPPYPGGPHIFYVPIDPGHTRFRVTAVFEELDANEYIFFDDIEWLCGFFIDIQHPYNNWPDIDETKTIPCPDQTALNITECSGDGYVTLHVRGVESPAQ